MIGRNDPCPCGSGQKYKKCCLPKHLEEQVLQAKEESFFDLKFRLAQDLYFFLAEKQGGEWTFDHEKNKHFDSSLGPSREGAGNMWAYFCRVYDNGLCGIDWFVEERGQRYSGEEWEMLERWRGMKLSCYQVVDHYEQGMIIEDIWSQERYRMPYCETMIKLPPWVVSVGMIEPFLEDWCIHGLFMWGHPDIASEARNRVRQLQEECSKAPGQELSPADILARNYPEIIKWSTKINSRKEKPVGNREEMREQVFVTREYTCEFPELLEKMLLETDDKYILAPETDPEEGTIVISRADKLDGILSTIPADRREQAWIRRNPDLE